MLAATLLALVCAAQVWAPVCSPARANVFGEDDRLIEGREPDSPFSAIVVVTEDEQDPAAGNRFGSGILISPCHVLTAHHVAFDSPESAAPEVVSMVHLGPPQERFPFTLSLRAHAVAWGDLASHTFNDWALLQLEICLDAQWRPWDLAPIDFSSALTLSNLGSAGHPAYGTRLGVSVDPLCQVHEQRGAVEGWWHDCAMERGESGGPLFTVDDDGQRHVVAIIIGDFFPQRDVIPTWDPRAANVAVPVANFATELLPLLTAPVPGGQEGRY